MVIKGILRTWNLTNFIKLDKIIEIIMKLENIKIGGLYRIDNYAIYSTDEPAIIPIEFVNEKYLVYNEKNSGYYVYYDAWNLLETIKNKIALTIEYKKLYVTFGIPHSEDHCGYQKYFKILINKDFYYAKPTILRKL